MRTLYLLRGVPGGGKSTLATQLLDMARGAGLSAVAVAADDFMTGDDGEYLFDPRRLGYCHAMCLDTAKTAMEVDVDAVIVHNTFTTDKELRPYIEAAESNGYKVVSLIVETRHGNKNVHGVPDDKLKQMRARFQISL